MAEYGTNDVREILIIIYFRIQTNNSYNKKSQHNSHCYSWKFNVYFNIGNLTKIKCYTIIK